MPEKTNDDENKHTTTVNNHTPCGYSIYTQCSFGDTKNKLDYYRGEDCIEKSTDHLKDHATCILDYEQKHLIKLTKEEYENHKNQKVCYICNKEFIAYDEDKNYYKVKNYCEFTGKYQGTCHKICRSKYKTLKEIPIIFHNGSDYDYHVIINQLAISFKMYGSFYCLSENSEKYNTFSVHFKTNKSIICRLKFADSFRFMNTSLLNLISNLSDQLYNNCFYCKNLLDYMIFKDNKVVCRCFERKKNISKYFNNELTKRFKNIYKFCENNKNKSLLLLRKGIYPYEYMDSRIKFNQDKTPSVNIFYSELTMENITNSDYKHAQRVFKTFNIKNLGDYHDLYVQSDVLLLTDVFENFRNQCLKTYDLDPGNFLTLPSLALQACLKTTKIRLDLITNQGMLLLIGQGIRGSLTQVIKKHFVANNDYLQDYDKNKNSRCLRYLDFNSLHAWAMYQKLPHKNFKFCKDLRYINQKFIKNYDGDSFEKGYILEVDIDYPKRLLSTK